MSKLEIEFKVDRCLRKAAILAAAGHDEIAMAWVRMACRWRAL